MAINTYLSIIILNANGLNAPIKRHRVAEWIKKNKKQKTQLEFSYKRTHLRCKEKHRLKVKGWKNMSHAKGNKVKAG